MRGEQWRRWPRRPRWRGSGDPWGAQAVSADESQSAVPANGLGTEQTPHSDGAGQTPSVLQVLMQQARALEAQADTIGQLVQQNQDLMEQVMGEPDDEPDQGHGYDMAGNRIKVS